MTCLHPLVKTEFLCQVLSGDIPWMEEKNNFQIVIVKLMKHKPPSRPIHAAVEDKCLAMYTVTCMLINACRVRKNRYFPLI